MSNKPRELKATTLLIDGSNLMYMAYHKFHKVHNETMGYVGTAFGFYHMVLSYIGKYNPDHVVVFLDSKEAKESNFRLSILSAYKGTREGRKAKIDFDQEHFNENVKLARKLLLYSGIPLVYDQDGMGFESDDYIATFALKLRGTKIILSSDKDFFQLLQHPKVSIFHPLKQEQFTKKNLFRKVNFTPEEHLDFLILNGDSSDNIPGVKGMGEVRIRAFLDNFGSIERYLKKVEVGKEPADSIYRVIKEVYERNKKLIDLTYIVTKNKLNQSKAPIIHKATNLKRLKALLYDMGAERLLLKYSTPLLDIDAKYHRMFKQPNEKD